MASKNLKAIVASRGHYTVKVNNKEALAFDSETILEGARKLPANVYQWGTGGLAPGIEKQGRLPVKNYLGTHFPVEIMTRPVYAQHTERKRSPCWACRFDHCGILTITEGPYKGFVGEEPEYEGFAAFASNIDQRDPLGVVVLSNDCDRLGMDLNEAGWIIAWVMECYEKGLITKKDTDGLDMTWGNVEATRAMLRKIAYREGIGDLLAEGVMRAAQRLAGGEAADMAIYLNNGVTPRGHDHRSHWTMILDVATSNSGTDEHGIQSPAPSSVGLPAATDLFSPEGTAAVLAAGAGKYHFDDCLGICRLSIMGSSTDKLINALNDVTGWDFKVEEVREVGLRISNLLRAFNVRHGLTPEREYPSERYASAALKGEGKGKAFLPVFEKARQDYYQNMGWDVTTGRPLPETLRRFSLDYVIKDLYKD